MTAILRHAGTILVAIGIVVALPGIAIAALGSLMNGDAL